MVLFRVVSVSKNSFTNVEGKHLQRSPKVFLGVLNNIKKVISPFGFRLIYQLICNKVDFKVCDRSPREYKNCTLNWKLIEEGEGVVKKESLNQNGKS